MARKPALFVPEFGKLVVAKDFALRTLTTGECAHVLDCTIPMIRYYVQKGMLEYADGSYENSWKRVTVESMECFMWSKYSKDFWSLVEVEK